MNKLIVNADDFGLSKGVNLGIIEGFKNGIVTSTTMMMNMNYIDHAINLHRDNEQLGLGIHLTLTAGKPLSSNVPTLIDEEGNFHSLSKIENVNLNSDEVYNEFKLQIDKFIKMVGTNPSHFDSHHHVHLNENIKDIVLKLSKEYNVPIRGINTNFENVYFTDKFYGDNVNYDFFELNRDIFLSNRIVEIMVHPAFVDHTLYSASRYSINRALELDILTSNSTIDFIKKNKIELINYNNIKSA